jgi:hypothetical protein
MYTVGSNKKNIARTGALHELEVKNNRGKQN